MNFKLIIFLFLPLFLFSYETKLAFHSNLTQAMKYQNSTSALQTWIAKVTSNTNSKVKLNVYDDYNKMLDDYFNSKIDILVISPFDYVNNIENFKKNTNEYWFMKKDMKNDYHKKYLIVNNSINSMKDLKNKKIVINKANKVSKIFLEKKYLEKMKENPRQILKNVEFIKSNSILLKIYFGTYKAGIIDSYEYDTMLELNPNIVKKVKILEQSPRIFSTMILAFNKNADITDYKKILKKFLESKEKIEVFNLLKIKSIVTNQNNLDDVEKYHNDYLNLKKRYDK